MNETDEQIMAALERKPFDNEHYYDYVQRVAYNDNKLWAGPLGALLVGSAIAKHLACGAPLPTNYQGLLSSRLPIR